MRFLAPITIFVVVSLFMLFPIAGYSGVWLDVAVDGDEREWIDVPYVLSDADVSIKVANNEANVYILVEYAFPVNHWYLYLDADMNIHSGCLSSKGVGIDNWLHYYESVNEVQLSTFDGCNAHSTRPLNFSRSGNVFEIAIPRNELFSGMKGISFVVQYSDVVGGYFMKRGGTSVTISPPTGEYISTQSFDIALIIESQQPASIHRNTFTAILDHFSVTEEILNSCGAHGALVEGGQTLRCGPLAAGFLEPGVHRFYVDMELSDGSSIADVVVWEVKESIE